MKEMPGTRNTGSDYKNTTLQQVTASVVANF